MQLRERVRYLAVVILIAGCFAIYGSFLLTSSVHKSSVRLLPMSTFNPRTDKTIQLETDYILFPKVLTSGSVHTLRIVPAKGTTVRPYLTILFEHNNGNDALERQFLKPSAIYPESHVEFTFKMFTSGEFRVTIFDDAVLLDEPWIWERAYFHLGPERTALHRFLVTFKEPYYFSSARKRLSTHLKTLPFCSLSDLADLQFGGRYLNPLLFPDAKTSFVDTSKWMYKVGDQPFFLRFLPAKCRMHYFNVQESRDCVANKNITLMGDSTLAESVNRLIFHILDDYAEVHCPPSTATCHDRNYGEAQLETTFNHADPPSYLSHVWVPSLDVCHGFVGAWAFRDSMFSDWMRFRSSYPESCRNYEDKLGLSLETDWKRSNGVWRTLPTKEQDYLFFSSGLHDLIHWKNPEGPEYKVGNYTEWLDKALGELAGTARNKIYVTVNPKMGKVDTATEHINKIARKLAKKHGYSVIDQNGVQSHRLVGEGWGMTGDYLFDFALANAQLYLNAICPKSK